MEMSVNRLKETSCLCNSNPLPDIGDLTAMGIENVDFDGFVRIAQRVDLIPPVDVKELPADLISYMVRSMVVKIP